MNPGILRHRITIQKHSAAENEIGEKTVGYQDDYSLWARVEPASARDIERLGKTETEVSHKILIRHKAGITSSNRITFKGRIFDIVGIINAGEQNKTLSIFCVERDEDNGYDGI
ncbi:hypothetical protein EAL2_c11080 [Peptoclostridium acidaminophilum DSM 3953]|uniref:Phage head-tail adaptor n=1 Tax=Peptoclostridium acidaminophilum DSM 3953 TaxID=1286171 RepID=W8U656_PEPAC|nr:phage head closure protein [Peptoclostridium acidaminophilum]AHM56406.1 hypothetical protein EAL2_c11080 [Peptoclostridium acidaminophilum DSM 3953]